MARVLVTGMSGVGKSTLLEALAAKGYPTVDTDYDGWTISSRWVERRMMDLLSKFSCLVVAGTAENQGAFYGRFDHVVLLSAPLDVIIDRVSRRTNNPYGKSAAEQGEIRGYLEDVEPLLRAGATAEFDARRPVHELVSAIEKLVAVPALTNDLNHSQSRSEHELN